MSSNQPTKEQEAMMALNDTFANLQAAQTVIGNAMKAVREAAQTFGVALQQKDAKIQELQKTQAETPAKIVPETKKS